MQKKRLLVKLEPELIKEFYHTLRKINPNRLNILKKASDNFIDICKKI